MLSRGAERERTQEIDPGKGRRQEKLPWATLSQTQDADEGRHANSGRGHGGQMAALAQEFIRETRERKGIAIAQAPESGSSESPGADHDFNGGASRDCQSENGAEGHKEETADVRFHG